MDLSLASIIAVCLLGVVVFILSRNLVLRRRMRALRGEMAEVQLKRLELEVALSNTAAGTDVQPDKGEGGKR